MTVSDNTQYQSTKRTRVVLLVAVVLLLALLIGLAVVFYRLIRPVGAPESASAAEDMVWVRSIYGFGPTAEEQLQMPTSVAVAPGGDIYATDPARARVMIFRSDGTFKRLLHTAGGGTSEGMFIRPEAIDIDDDGNVYIADSWARKVIVFDDAGKYLREWPVELQARGVTATDDKVYVLDVGRVLIFDKQGKPLGSFGQRGPKPGMLDAYQGIAVRDDTIFVADSFNKRLQAFDSSGTVQWVVPKGTASRKGPAARSGTGSDESASEAVPDHRWDLPQDLVFDARGRIVVVDAFQFEIAVVDATTGKLIARYGEYGRQDGEFFYPTSIDYDSTRDWFVVADTNNNRVQIVRIPDSANPNAAAVWRSASSPYRYLAVPLVLLIVAVVLSMYSFWRLRRAGAR